MDFGCYEWRTSVHYFFDVLYIFGSSHCIISLTMILSGIFDILIRLANHVNTEAVLFLVKFRINTCSKCTFKNRSHLANEHEQTAQWKMRSTAGQDSSVGGVKMARRYMNHDVWVDIMGQKQNDRSRIFVTIHLFRRHNERKYTTELEDVAVQVHADHMK